MKDLYTDLHKDQDGLITSQIDISAIAQNRRAQFTSSTPFTPKYVYSTLGVSGKASAAFTYNERIRRQFILLENPEKKSRIALLHAAQVEKIKKAKERRRLGVIGRNEAVEKGMWKLKKEQARWDLFVPLHRLWLGYMSELLGLAAPPASGTPSPKDMPSSAGMHAKLVKADFHGSIMTVRRSKNPALIDLSGIVVHETENAFRVVTRKNKSKLIPKHGSVFAFAVPLYSTLDTPKSSPPTADASSPQSSQTSTTVLEAPHIEFELYGNQFQFRSAERASKKFKPKETIEL